MESNCFKYLKLWNFMLNVFSPMKRKKEYILGLEFLKLLIFQKNVSVGINYLRTNKQKRVSFI